MCACLCVVAKLTLDRIPVVGKHEGLTQTVALWNHQAHKASSELNIELYKQQNSESIEKKNKKADSMQHNAI
jgi:hypothetical protein